MEHRLELTYTTEDDGVHVYCPDCGFTSCLGQHPVIADAQAAQDAHLRDIASQTEHRASRA